LSPVVSPIDHVPTDHVPTDHVPTNHVPIDHVSVPENVHVNVRVSVPVNVSNDVRANSLSLNQRQTPRATQRKPNAIC